MILGAKGGGAGRQSVKAVEAGMTMEDKQKARAMLGEGADPDNSEAFK